MRRLLLLVLLVAAFASCNESKGDEGEPMGSGDRCKSNLAAVVDEGRLLDDGVEIEEVSSVEDEIADAIETVCAEGPPSLTIEDGAVRVVVEVRARTTSH